MLQKRACCGSRKRDYGRQESRHVQSNRGGVLPKAPCANHSELGASIQRLVELGQELRVGQGVCRACQWQWPTAAGTHAAFRFHLHVFSDNEDQDGSPECDWSFDDVFEPQPVFTRPCLGESLRAGRGIAHVPRARQDIRDATCGARKCHH